MKVEVEVEVEVYCCLYHRKRLREGRELLTMYVSEADALKLETPGPRPKIISTAY